MKFICHRGNINGPNTQYENKPEYIQNALAAGYDVEVDVWLMSDGFYLGHDMPHYKIDKYFLRNQRLWVHCKNSKAYFDLIKHNDVNCFFQTDEEFVLTSRGYIWAHSKATTRNEKTIIVQLNCSDWDRLNPPFAICSDYVQRNSTDWDVCNPQAVPQNISQHKLPFDLLIIDIDGVMTDGTKMYDKEGKIFGKRYSDLDFTAIKRFMAAGVNVCFLSGDKTINEAMAKTRKIDFYHNEPGVDKADMLTEIKKHYKANSTAYIGDDYYDISIMNSVNLSFCPQNSPAAVRRTASAIINVTAGNGVIAGLYDLFEEKIPYVFPKDSPDVNPR
jgi:YrbI family 3-deoxy-D-manno-octulosonate 8-phosphate phosphatase